VFFTVVGKAAEEARAVDVLGFITAKRTGRPSTEPLQPVSADDGSAGVSTSTVARPLSTISGFFAYLQARGDIPANLVPRGLPTRRERSRPGQGVPLTRRTRRLMSGRPVSPASRTVFEAERIVHGQPRSTAAVAD
jgi:hypothetical protein